MDTGILLKWKMLAPDVQEKARQFQELLYHWNRKINLVSRKSGGFDFRKEFLDSLFPLRNGIIPEGSAVADIGSGGGFPVIPLAIGGGPRRRFYAVESIAKKAIFLREAKRVLGLAGLEIINARITGKLPVTVNYITLKKSIAPGKELFNNLLNDNGLNSIIYYAGGAADKILYLKSPTVKAWEYFVNSLENKRYLYQITKIHQS